MSQTARFQEILRKLGRVVSAAPEVASALGYDVAAALEDPDDHW